MKKQTIKELEALAKAYINARDKLLDIIINYKGVGTKTYYNTVLKNLTAEIKRLEEETGKYIGSAIPREYKAGLDEVYSHFTRNNLAMKKPSAFAQIHNDAIYGLAREMQYHIGQGIEQAGRQVLRYLDESRDNALRKAGLEASAEKIAMGSTVRDMQKNLVERLQNEGFMTVQYGQGKNAYQVGIDSYAQMVSRSTTREAGNLARENQLIENGYDLVEMTTHYPTCEKCAVFQGRVYSLTGKDKRFPALFKTAFKGGYRNVHPNCRHSIVPFIEELHSDEEVQQDITKSNKPFKDNRPDAEKGLYSKQQAQNRQIRQDRYQYERYKARLGEDAPKSFHGFRQMKKAGGEKWDFMQLDYKRRNKLVDNPDLKLLNAEFATADNAKFGKYLFNPDNKNGYAKGVAFDSRLGYNKDNWQELQRELLQRASIYSAKYNRDAPYGVKLFQQNQILYGLKNKPANVKVIWGVDADKTKLVTCMIEEVK